MKTKQTLAERIRARVSKRVRAQSRLNRAAVAWALDEGDTWLANKRQRYAVSPLRVELALAVRAFQKASKA